MYKKVYMLNTGELKQIWNFFLKKLAQMIQFLETIIQQI